MTTQYTSILKLALPVTGELSGTWGDVVNDNITSMVEEAIAGLATINSWSSNSHTLTTANGTSAEARCAMLVLTDTGTALTGAATVVCPTSSKIYIVKNDCGQTATIQTSGGTGVAIPDGDTMFVFCDGTNVVQAVTRLIDADVSFTTLKGTGAVIVTNILDEDDMASDSATALATQQSIKAYVDAQISANNDLAEILANGNTTGGTDLVVSAGDTLTADTISETTADNGVVIDGVTVKDGGINGVAVGTGAGSVSTNTAVGASALASNTTGASNTAVGEQSLTSNTTASYSTAVGSKALQDNTASSNTAVGYFAGGNNTTGTGNTFLGSSSGSTQTTGTSNTAIGASAGAKVTTGSNNVLIGESAGYQFTFDPINPPFTFITGITTTSGSVVIGQDAGSTANGINTIVGYQSHRKNGVENATLGYQTLGFGYWHYGLATNSYNVAVGHKALRAANGVSNSVAVGHEALIAATTGDNNTAVGYKAGSAITSGSKNTIIGAYNGNQGGLDIRTSSNNVVLSDGDGNIAGRWANGGSWYQLSNSATWAITSDSRIKQNVATITNGLDVVMALRPVEFDYIIGGQHTEGFLAQEYEAVLPNQIIEDANIGDELKELTNGEPVKGIQQNLVPYLVSAIQALKAEFDAYKATHP